MIIRTGNDLTEKLPYNIWKYELIVCIVVGCREQEKACRILPFCKHGFYNPKEK